MCVGDINSVSNMAMENVQKIKCQDINCVSKIAVIDDYNKKPKEAVFQKDVLAIFTYYSKIVLFFSGNILKKFENSKWYKILTNTTQPAHLVTLLAVCLIGCLMYTNSNNEEQIKSSHLLNILYLGSVSAHFGAQLWMSFVSGLSLYFCLPRHIFGMVQRILFPKYFLINAVLSLISLSIFLRNNNTKLDLPQVLMQVGTLITCFLIELLVRLYLTPPLLHLMEKAKEFEDAAGVGMEVGRYNIGNLLDNKQYLKVYKTFRRLHMTVAIGNVITMGCSILHLHYLASKL